MNIQTALKRQYHAAMKMLREAIERCPDELWTTGPQAVPFWKVAYHTLFYTHLYLGRDEASFRPWVDHRAGMESQRQPPADPPLSRERMLAYWKFVDDMIDPAVDGFDLDADTCGFDWYRMPKLDHQINNIRHIQHHAAILSARLRLANGTNIPWAKGERD